jgi:hypothetical protein
MFSQWFVQMQERRSVIVPETPARVRIMDEPLVGKNRLIIQLLPDLDLTTLKFETEYRLTLTLKSEGIVQQIWDLPDARLSEKRFDGHFNLLTIEYRQIELKVG